MSAGKTAPAIPLTEPRSRAPEHKTAAAKRSANSIVGSPLPPSVVGHVRLGTQRTPADDAPVGGGHLSGETQSAAAAPDLLSLRIVAEVFDDLEKQRIATTNRAERGGIDPVFLEPTLARLKDAENEARLVMLRCYRKACPAGVRAWQEDTPGIGEHLLARLLGAIGHPVYTMVYEWQGSGHDRVLVEVGPLQRSVSQLWSYCGHGDPLRKRAQGMSAAEAAAMGNPRAKMLVHLLAESCMKCAGGPDRNGKPLPLSPYRHVYDEARMDYEARDWTDLHRHNAALRKVGKAILKDLWLAAGGAKSQATPRRVPPLPAAVADSGR